MTKRQRVGDNCKHIVDCVSAGLTKETCANVKTFADEALDPEVNLMLRAIHDSSAHLGSNQKKPRPFSFKGELQSYNAHLNFIGKQAKDTPALFTEIVDQVSYYGYTGGFPQQKIITMTDFNRVKLGEVKGYKIVNRDLVPDSI